MRSRFITAFLMVLIGTDAAVAETGYVRAREAKVMTSPTASAEVVISLDKGAEVEILKRQGRWLSVTVGEHAGWLSGLLVGDKPPMKKISVLDDSESAELQSSARRRASTATSSAAARGLRTDERARQSDAGMANFGALRQVEEMDVSEEEALIFMEQGE